MEGRKLGEDQYVEMVVEAEVGVVGVSSNERMKSGKDTGLVVGLRRTSRARTPPTHLLSQRCMGFEYKESDTTSPFQRDQQWQQGSKTM